MIHLVLLFLTFLSTTFGGSLYQGGNPLENPADMAQGLSYSLPLLAILLGHELGHYFACRRHGLHATLPYFIPVPPPIFLFGTLGAFIKIRSPIRDRRALLDVGVAGPLTGMVLAIPIAAVGISMSSFVPKAQTEGGLMLGDSLLFVFLVRLVKGAAPVSSDLMLHPMAFAGWIGFLVTALNLLPASQLDGGHIFYSLWPRRHRAMTRALVVGLLALGLTTWQGWILWALIITLMGSRHPPVAEDVAPSPFYPFHAAPVGYPGLDSTRRKLGILALVVFTVTFTPEPLKIAPIRHPNLQPLPRQERRERRRPLGDDWVESRPGGSRHESALAPRRVPILPEDVRHSPGFCMTAAAAKAPSAGPPTPA